MFDWPRVTRKSVPSSTVASERGMRSLAVHPGMVVRTTQPLQMGGAVTWRHRQLTDRDES